MEGKIVSPETILDHTIAYTIGASEVLEGNGEACDLQSPSLALVPFGPPFYTAILQAAGTLALQKNIKTAMIVYQQTKKAKEMHICNENIGPILGRTFVFPDTIKKIPATISAFTKFTSFTKFARDLENQLYFIRVLSEIEELVLVGIGEDLSQKDIATSLSFIEKKIGNPAIFFATNLSEDKEYGSCREIDEQRISDIIQGKLKKTKKNLISKLFSQYTKKQKKIPQILAYTNTGDLGGNKKKTNSYACLVA